MKLYISSKNSGPRCVNHIETCTSNEIVIDTIFSNFNGLAPVLTVHTVTIFRHGLNFVRCTIFLKKGLAVQHHIRLLPTVLLWLNVRIYVAKAMQLVHTSETRAAHLRLPS